MRFLQKILFIHLFYPLLILLLPFYVRYSCRFVYLMIINWVLLINCRDGKQHLLLYLCFFQYVFMLFFCVAISQQFLLLYQVGDLLHALYLFILDFFLNFLKLFLFLFNSISQCGQRWQYQFHSQSIQMIGYSHLLRFYFTMLRELI